MSAPTNAIPEGIEISALTSADLLPLLEIARLGILSWGREVIPSEVEERARRLEEEVLTLDPGKKGLFVASRRGVVVGFCRVVQDRNDNPTWWLLGLAVHPDHRRQGIATTLVRACIVYVQERGTTAIRSETHLDNKVSIHFHESIGFRNEGRFTAFDGDEKVAFSLTLT